MYKIGVPAPSKVNGDESIYQDIMESSFYTIQVTACVPNTQTGPQLYTLRDATSQFNTRLNSVLGQVASECGAGGAPSISWPIQIHAIVDTPISEQFTNQYDESFVSRITNAVGGGINELRQIMGIRNLEELNAKIQQMKQNVKQKGGGFFLDTLLGIAGQVTSAGAALEQAMGGNRSTRAIANLFQGHKIEFPKVWRDSNYSTSYSFTIRLYNPNPGDVNSTFKHIITPLATLLLFVVPYSDDGFTYDWPFFCKAYAPGLFKLKYGAFADIAVTKGGDTIAIAFNQIPAIVDVRITLIDLFSTMLGGNGQQTNIVDYLATMATPREVKGFEFRLATLTPPALSNQSATPTTTLPTDVAQASTTLNMQQFNSYLQNNLPESISNPDSNLVNDMHNMLQNPNTQSLLRDYERGLNLLRSRSLSTTLALSSTRTSPLLEQLQSRTIVNRPSNSRLANILMSNPTDSQFLNRSLRDIATRALSHPAPDDTIRASLAYLDPSTLRPYARRDVANSLRPHLLLRLREDYPDITDSDINATANVLADYGLDESERRVLGRTSSRIVV